MNKIQIEAGRCSRCGACVLTCPAALFVQSEKEDLPRVEREEFCIACGHCVAVCPEDAVMHDAFPAERVRPIRREMLPAPDQVLELMRARRSIRAFADKPVDKAAVETIIEAARLAPTGHNVQSTAYTVVQSRETLDRITRLTADFLEETIRLLRNPVTRGLYTLLKGREVRAALEMLPEFDLLVQAVNAGLDPVLRGAPCLIVFHARADSVLPDANAQLAAQNAALAAQAMGLGSCYTGYVLAACKRGSAIPRLIGIPKGHRVFAGLVIGHPKFVYKKWPDRRPAEVTWA